MDGIVKNDEIIKLARSRMSEAVDADSKNREAAVDDLHHLSAEQWDSETRDERESEGRPVITINRLPQFVRQVTGDIRNLNPAVKVLPADGEASEDIAEIYEGLTRHIEHRSDASSVYEAAAESAAQCGIGYFRILTEYADEDSFDQDIRIKRIHNPLSVYCDPAAREPTREDADYFFISDQMKTEEFREKYPNKASVDVDTDRDTDGMEHWYAEGAVVVAEYLWKQPVKKEIGLMRDGTVVENPVAPMDIIRKRTVDTHKVMWAKISGKDVLEGPQELPCKYLPIVAVTGEEMHVEDEVIRTSVIRYAKDPQRLYNYWSSAQAEMVMLQPKAPYLVTAKQVAGLEEFWNQANTANRPYLPYNPDEKAPGVPQRAQPPVSSQGMAQEVMKAAEDMKATTGIYDAGLGNQGNEQSGVAIRQRQLEGDISTSIYADNLAKAIAYCGRIIVDMIPKVFDTNRMVRIVGQDDTEKMVEVNGLRTSIDGVELINPLGQGKYDVRVTVGPNYTTRRQETAESMMQFVQAFPQAGQVAGDLIAEAMDWPDSDKLAYRLKKILPPGMRDTDDLSPEEQQQMQQQMQQQQMQQQLDFEDRQSEVAKNRAEAQEASFDAEKAQYEVFDQQLELAAKNGQLNAAISQLVQQEVQRALFAGGGTRG